VRSLSGIRYALIGTCVAALCLTAAAAAGAEVVDKYVYPTEYPNASFDGSDAVGAGAFGDPRFIAVDQSSGDVYVSSGGAVYHLNADGESLPFGAIAPNTAFEAYMYYQAGLAVDNSGTATQGRIYVKTPEALSAYQPTGAPVGSPFPFEIPGGCGVEVAPDGGVWVVSEGSAINRFSPSGAPSNESIPTGGNCSFGIDADENFFSGALPPEPVKKYSRAGALLDPEWSETGKGSGFLTVDRSSGEVLATFPDIEGDHAIVLGPDGSFLSSFGYVERSTGYPGLGGFPTGIAVNESSDTVYVGNRSTGKVDMFVRTGPITIPTVSTDPAATTVTSAVLKGSIDPDSANGGTDVTDCSFEWGFSVPYEHVVPCEQTMPAGAPTQVTAAVPGLEEGKVYHFRIIANSGNKVEAYGQDRTFQASETPVTSDEYTSEVFSDGAKLNATVIPRGAKTTYHFEYGTAPCSATACTPMSNFVIDELLGQYATRDGAQVLTGLEPGTTYYWRIVAENHNGSIPGPDHTFTTFPLDTVTVDSCDNALVRKQTGAAHTMECRAYELVSAADTGGYDVESSLVPGQTPLPGYPGATNPPRALYTVHYGAIPGVGDPPNFGDDPYIATRGAAGWTTKYVGLPVSDTPDPEVFGSSLLGADAGLDTFAFGGPDLCEPCFADGSTGVPVRLPSGGLIQGMDESLPMSTRDSGTEVREPLSGDGSQLVFAGDNGGVSIYDRDLRGGGTQVVSTLPDGTTMSGEVAELGISDDGSRIVIGRVVGSDDQGNRLYDLYMHRGGDSHSVVIAQTAHGATYGGMTADGETVYFTTVDPLSGDSDSSADLYRAEIGSGTPVVSRVSMGAGSGGNTDGCPPAEEWNLVIAPAGCSVLPISGGGGVAGQTGVTAFLSPELLTGSGGIEGEPNLYLAATDGSLQFVATLDVDDPLVSHAAVDAAQRHTADFQLTPSGRFAVFTSRRPITGYPTGGYLEVYRYDADSEELTCASCASTGAQAESDATLPRAGGALSDDGRVFFTSRNPLNLRDLNGRSDVYQTSTQGPKLVSTGVSAFDSALLSASRDGKDVYFFTHDVLVPQDANGNLVKIYDARQGGGFYVPQTLPPCKASDECHGPGTQAPASPDIGTYKGVGGQTSPKPAACKRKQVRRRGRCVRRSGVRHRAKKRRPRGSKKHREAGR
jgi:hypothetical protein